MKIADNGKYGPLIGNFLKRRTMFSDRIQIRVAIDLKLLADKAQAISSEVNDTTSNCHGKFVTLRRSFPSRLFPTAHNEMNQSSQAIVRDSFNLLRDSLPESAALRSHRGKGILFGEERRNAVEHNSRIPIALFLAELADKRALTLS